MFGEEEVVEEEVGSVKSTCRYLLKERLFFVALSLLSFPLPFTLFSFFFSATVAAADRMKTVPVSLFSQHVQDLHQSRDKGFEMEYQVDES